jgi:hypothetical protein
LGQKWILPQETTRSPWSMWLNPVTGRAGGYLRMCPSHTLFFHGGPDDPNEPSPRDMLCKIPPQLPLTMPPCRVLMRHLILMSLKHFCGAYTYTCPLAWWITPPHDLSRAFSNWPLVPFAWSPHVILPTPLSTCTLLPPFSISCVTLLHRLATIMLITSINVDCFIKSWSGYLLSYSLYLAYHYST